MSFIGVNPLIHSHWAALHVNEIHSRDLLSDLKPTVDCERDPTVSNISPTKKSHTNKQHNLLGKVWKLILHVFLIVLRCLGKFGEAV